MGKGKFKGSEENVAFVLTGEFILKFWFSRFLRVGEVAGLSYYWVSSDLFCWLAGFA